MSLEIERRGPALHVKILHTRVDGDAPLLPRIQASCPDPGLLQSIEFDFQHVEYINSLGITDLVNIHRAYNDGPHTVVLRLLQVRHKVNAILELVDLGKIAEIQLAHN